MNKDLEEKMENVRKWKEDREEKVRVLIRGDFKVRKERRERIKEEGEERIKEKKRKSRNKTINKEGRKLLDFLGELG